MIWYVYKTVGVMVHVCNSWCCGICVWVWQLVLWYVCVTVSVVVLVFVTVGIMGCVCVCDSWCYGMCAFQYCGMFARQLV